MDKTKHGWTIIDADAGIWMRKYNFGSNPNAQATTFAARLHDGRVLAISPGTGFDDGAFEDLGELGDVAGVVSNNGFHHLGIRDWRKRFPDARFFACDLAAARIAKKNADAGELEPLAKVSDLLGDGDVGIREAPGTKCGETWMWAKRGDGSYAIFTSDVICNWDKFPGNFFLNFLWKMTKSGPGYKLFHLAMMAIVKDKKTLLRQLRDDLEAHPPSVVVPAHGPIAARDGLAEETIALIDTAL